MRKPLTTIILSGFVKVSILGSEGFVANNLIAGLENSFDILSADIIQSSTHKNYHRFDITNSESVNKTTYNSDIVINLVNDPLVSSLDGTIKNAQINIIGMLNVLESCRKNDVKKIIFTSASSLIGNPKEFSVTESHPANPKTAYGLTKLTVEHYLRLYNELYGLDFVVFRFFNIYGPFQKTGLIPSIYQKIMNNEPITIFGDGNQVRDYIYVGDVIPFFKKIISTDIGNNSTFNMGTGHGTSIIELVKLFSNILNVKPNIEYAPERKGEIGNFIADTRKLEKTFGKKPNTSINDGLELTLSWLKNQ